MLDSKKKKKEIVECLKQTPIIQYACRKAGVGRATYYRWRNEDEDFASETDEAMQEGVSIINEIAESQLIGLIKEKKLNAISYWLRHNHNKYTNKVEISGQIKTETSELTKEQEQTIKKALELSSLIEDSNKLNNNQEGEK